MIILEGKVVSKSIDKNGTLFCGIEIPDHQYSNCATTIRVEANYELGQVLEVRILARYERHIDDPLPDAPIPYAENH